MDNLIPMISVLIVVTAYCMGVWTGSLFSCRGAGRTGGVSSGGRSGGDRGSGERGSGGKHMKTVMAEVCGEDGTEDSSSAADGVCGSAAGGAPNAQPKDEILEAFMKYQ